MDTSALSKNRLFATTTKLEACSGGLFFRIRGGTTENLKKICETT
jgi:hypothetical protein